MTDPLRLLRDADPAARLTDADGPPPRHVLDAIVASRPPRRRRRPPRRLVVAAAAAAVAVVALLGVLAPDERTDLAARAYAVTTPGDRILYIELTTENAAPGLETARSVDRIWQQGDRAHVIHAIVGPDGRPKTAPQFGRAWVYEYVEDGGVTQLRMPDGTVDRIPGPIGPGVAGVLGLDQGNFVDLFRARYSDAVLRDAGRTTFADRPAQSYEVKHHIPGIRETYYLHPATGMPLGSVRTFELGRRGGVGRQTEVVRRIDRLPATPQNRARLAPPWAEDVRQSPRAPSPTGQATPVPPSPQ
jgi:hypothetical protein